MNSISTESNRKAITTMGHLIAGDLLQFWRQPCQHKQLTRTTSSGTGWTAGTTASTCLSSHPSRSHRNGPRRPTFQAGRVRLPRWKAKTSMMTWCWQRSALSPIPLRSQPSQAGSKAAERSLLPTGSAATTMRGSPTRSRLKRY